MNILVVGGGIFGCSIALELSKTDHEITLIEKNTDIMDNASKCNHNRIHYGYHYPRSPETALQSLDGLLSFVMKYKDALVTNFPNYYAIAKNNSNVTSEQYKNFCNQVGIGYQVEYPSADIMNPELLENSYRVEEPIFDWEILKKIIKNDLLNSKVKLKLNTTFSEQDLNYDFIINCTYSEINNVNELVGVPKLKFKLQDVVVPIFKYHHSKIGLTVMDGPFCSIMPKGNNTNEFLLYHAKYSVLSDTETDSIDPVPDIEFNLKMIKNDSINYFPFLKSADFIDYWRTIRAIPINSDDSRLSKIITYPENSKFITVFSGKINTCVKMAKQIKQGILNGNFDTEIIV